jgi:serine/threonine-protein kinase RsbW
MKFIAKLENLQKIYIFIEKSVEGVLSKKKIIKLELAIEEIFTNIIKHAYKYVEKDVEILLEKKDGVFFITIIDEGPFFDPTKVFVDKAKNNQNSILEDVKPGGVGLLLIRKNVDEIEYKRENDKNGLIISVLS